MLTNGQIYIETRAGGGLNQWGEPTADTALWSEKPIDCAIVPNTDNRLGKYEDGEYHQASYSLTVETADFDAARIRLVREGADLGEYRVISVRPLSVGRTLILV